MLGPSHCADAEWYLRDPLAVACPVILEEPKLSRSFASTRKAGESAPRTAEAELSIMISRQVSRGLVGQSIIVGFTL